MTGATDVGLGSGCLIVGRCSSCCCVLVTFSDVLAHNAMKGTSTSAREIRHVFASAARLASADETGPGMGSFKATLTREELRGWALAHMGIEVFVKRMLTNAPVLEEGILRIMSGAKNKAVSWGPSSTVGFDEMVTYLESRGTAMEPERQDVKQFFAEVANRHPPNPQLTLAPPRGGSCLATRWTIRAMV